jgi:hypothetical protein
VESLDDVSGFPRFAGTDQGRGKADGMERNVILAEKLDVPNVIGFPPPSLPIPTRSFRVGPFLCRGDIADGGVEPDIEDLSLESRARHGDAPCEIARNAAVPEVAVQPASRQRCHERRPAGLGVQPFAQPLDQERLPQEQVRAFLRLQRRVAGEGGTRRDQFGGIEESAAAVALISPGGGKPAMWASA